MKLTRLVRWTELSIFWFIMLNMFFIKEQTDFWNIASRILQLIDYLDLFVELKWLFLLLNWTMWSSWRKNRFVRYCKHDYDSDHTASKPNNIDRWIDYLDLFVELKKFFLLYWSMWSSWRKTDWWDIASMIHSFKVKQLDLFVELNSLFSWPSKVWKKTFTAFTIFFQSHKSY